MKSKYILIFVLLFSIKQSYAQKCTELLTDISVFSPTTTGLTGCLSSNNGTITFNYRPGFNPANLSYQISGKNRQTQARTPFFPTQVAQERIVLSGLESGTYDSFFVQGPAGCIDTFFFPTVVNPPTNLFYTPIPFDVTGCVGSSSGKIEFLFTVTATDFNYQITAFDTVGIPYGPFGPANNKITIANLAANQFSSFRVDGPGGCVDFITENITISEPPNPLEIDTIIVTNATCGGNGSIFIQPQGGQEPYIINTEGGNPFQTFSGPSPSNLGGGSYEVTVIDAIGCEVKSSGIQLIEGDTFKVQIVLDGSNVINLGESVSGSVELHPSSSGFNPSNFSYEWQSDYRISCVDCADPTFNPCRDTTYSVVVREDSAGCVAVASQNIEVEGSFNPFIPNAFTPNGTGPAQNEVIRVFGTGLDQVEMVVYDSKGAMVFNGSGFHEDVIWDGTMSGRPLNSGTYLYDVKITSICEEQDVKRGQILLIR